jgi:hypothetical protein
MVDNGQLLPGLPVELACHVPGWSRRDGRRLEHLLANKDTRRTHSIEQRSATQNVGGKELGPRQAEGEQAEHDGAGERDEDARCEMPSPHLPNAHPTAAPTGMTTTAM